MFDNNDDEAQFFKQCTMQNGLRKFVSWLLRNLLFLSSEYKKKENKFFRSYLIIGSGWVSGTWVKWTMDVNVNSW